MVAYENGNLIVKIEDDAGVDDQDLAKSNNQISCHLVIYISGYSKRLMNNVIREIDSFYSTNSFYGDTDSPYIHKKHWSTSVEKSFVGNSHGFGKNDYGNASMFYDWYLAPKIMYCLVINDYRVISAKRSFEGKDSEEHEMIKLDKTICLSE